MNSAGLRVDAESIFVCMFQFHKMLYKLEREGYVRKVADSMPSLWHLIEGA